MYSLSDRANALVINSDRLTNLKGYLVDVNAHHKGVVDYTRRIVNPESFISNVHQYIDSNRLPKDFFFVKEINGVKEISTMTKHAYGDIYSLPIKVNKGVRLPAYNTVFGISSVTLPELLKLNYGEKNTLEQPEYNYLKEKYGNLIDKAIISNQERIKKRSHIGNTFDIDGIIHGINFSSLFNESTKYQKILLMSDESVDTILYTPFKPYALIKSDEESKITSLSYYKIDEKNKFKGDVKFNIDKTPEFLTKTILDRKQYTFYNEGEGTLNKKDVSFNDSVDLMPIYNSSENTAYKNNKSKIVQYTNRLFSQNKINSLINRFHTNNPDELEAGDLNTAFNEKYGLSRGRNLLNTVSEGDGVYDNPYCRVWTAHHQYSKIKHLIRPGEDGAFDAQKQLTALRPNNGATRLTNNSVLDSNGLVRIAPTHVGETKNLMFSIENLAWKDNINVFNESQCGPNKGRIMWFPPYNLRFSENVSVNWNANNFIGRGEQIYTYTNTERSGTLDFTLLIDHPSILDKWINGKGTNTGNKNQDEELLRFFAGCGNLKGGSEAVNDGSTKNKKNDTDQTINVDGGPDQQKETIAGLFMFFPDDYDFKKKSDYNTLIKNIGDYEENGLNNSLSSENINKICGVKETLNGNEIQIITFSQFSADDANIENLIDWSGVNKKTEGSEDKPEDKPEDGNKPEEKPEDGNKPEDKPEDGNKPEDKPEDDNKPEENSEDGNKPEENSEDGNKSEENSEDGNKPEEKADNGAKAEKEIQYDIEYEIYGIANKVIESASSEQKDVKGTKTTDKLANDRLATLKTILTKKLNVEEKNIKVTECKTIDIESGNNEEIKLNSCAYVLVRVKWKNTALPNGNTLLNDIKDGLENASSSNMASTTSKTSSEASYDVEYTYFKKVQKESPLVHKYISEKVKYFDPAFHSVSPEGFNARLTFLHQCTRQGSTTSVNRKGAKSNDYEKFAGNLAFGRAPFCVLRIGDFFNTKICIDSMSISYDNNGVQWDLNPEGIGVQPMYANISLNFKFLGGQDIEGPIERLQNAITSNYYANASIYNKHADTKNKTYDPNV
jgi:hypothetical protein